MDSWDVANVEDMSMMFQLASSFNGDISNWNTGSLTNAQNLFMDATSFNRDIGSWNVSNVQYMRWMFRGATTFLQDLSNWNAPNISAHSTGCEDFAFSATTWLNAYGGSIADKTPPLSASLTRLV